MLGWWIIVSTETPEERDGATDHKAATLATWDTGVSGTDWLLKLVQEGKAKEHGPRGGYPDRYTAAARDVLPLFADGPPLPRGIGVVAEDDKAGKSNRNVIVHWDRIAACLPGQVLTIDVWDQS